MDFGNRIEEILSEMLSEPLLQDFVHLRPILLQAMNKELCDVLVEDEPDCIVIQLKVQDLSKAKANRNDDLWVKKQLAKAEKQIKGAVRSMPIYDLACFNPARGEITFKAGQLKAKHGIVVVDYNSLPFLLDDKLENRTKQNIPIHYLTYNDFIVLCQNLKTLPDLMNYLDERAKIPKWSRPQLADEKNIYAYYLMNKAEFPYSVKRVDFINKWEILTVKYKEKYSKKIMEDNETELFDQILKAMYSSDPIMTQFAPTFLKRLVLQKTRTELRLAGH